jgi:hypothetical protein
MYTRMAFKCGVTHLVPFKDQENNESTSMTVLIGKLNLSFIIIFNLLISHSFCCLIKIIRHLHEMNWLRYLKGKSLHF